MSPAEALTALTANPRYFIQYYPLGVMVSSPQIPMGVDPAVYNAQFNFNHQQTNTERLIISKIGKPGTTCCISTFNSHNGATRPGRILSFRTHNISSFEIANTILVAALRRGATNFHANVVPVAVYAFGMEHQLPSFRLDNTINYMVTSLLTGCCFCWAHVGDTVYCAHVKPTPAREDRQHNPIITPHTISGRDLQIRIRNGHFAHLPHTQVHTFGRESYGVVEANGQERNTRAVIIGVRSEGTWAFYTQLSDNTTDYKRIVQAARKYSLDGTMSTIR